MDAEVVVEEFERLGEGLLGLAEAVSVGQNAAEGVVGDVEVGREVDGVADALLGLLVVAGLAEEFGEVVEGLGGTCRSDGTAEVVLGHVAAVALEHDRAHDVVGESVVAVEAEELAGVLLGGGLVDEHEVQAEDPLHEDRKAGAERRGAFEGVARLLVEVLAPGVRELAARDVDEVVVRRAGHGLHAREDVLLDLVEVAHLDDGDGQHAEGLEVARLEFRDFGQGDAGRLGLVGGEVEGGAFKGDGAVVGAGGLGL